MTDLAEFLLARIAEDQEAAEAPADEMCSQGWKDEHKIGLTWTAEVTRQGNMEGGLIVGEGGALWDDEGSVTLDMPPNAARHVARWDPARVLAECAAKRQVVLAYRVFWEQAKQAARAGQNDLAATARNMYAGVQAAMECLALPYADHPDYRQEWKP